MAYPGLSPFTVSFSLVTAFASVKAKQKLSQNQRGHNLQDTTGFKLFEIPIIIKTNKEIREAQN
jgi:hypothetical protein